eukprot:scaffold14574_cov120-Isochrysis_galbana.AAC.9
MILGGDWGWSIWSGESERFEGAARGESRHGCAGRRGQASWDGAVEARSRKRYGGGLAPTRGTALGRACAAVNGATQSRSEWCKTGPV